MNEYEKKQLIKNISRIAVSIVIMLIAYFFFGLYGEKGEIDYTENDIVIEDSSDDEIEMNTEVVEPQYIICDISGAVENPGVYSITNDARLDDLVEMAGGLTRDADIDCINRARTLTDGEKIYIPYIGEMSIQDKGNWIDRSAAFESNSTDKININTASSEELQKVPGIGPVTAEKIIKYREENGLFTSVEDIKKVSGIGDKTFKNIEEYIFA